ncbi:putative RDD family membrane protein YckC [Arthrobacter stackebrandtii]|uniref:RDD family membrane protein YckC n=1 Tax=Arthrobacter stackebrandtii TaxID=272161 RepID=A0ABS4Z2I9_9MICC|nr:RDD family protein [Arthrobacter stackebrandtii]MBP2414478.1 putative RDD family membrane protein YckC [Arthrobacter stackebrandtii]PYH01604.1 RDD family protein [Arthrobacter stackebrandtii]
MRWRRLAALLVDWCCMLGWAGAVAAVGVPLYLLGEVRLDGLLAENLVGLTMVAPVVAGAAWFESRARAATPGKRVLGLRVEHDGAPPAFRRALLRNTVKIGAPWLLGHAATFAVLATLANETVPAWVAALAVFANLVPLVWLASLFTPGGRTIHDRLSGTRVAAATAPPTPTRA